MTSTGHISSKPTIRDNVSLQSSSVSENAVLRIGEVYPWSWFLSIPDPGSRNQKQQQKRGVKTILLSFLFCSHKCHKIENYFSFELRRKKFWANLPRIIELSTQKIYIKLSKYRFGIRDPEKNLFQGQKDTEARIPDPDRKHWKNVSLYQAGGWGENLGAVSEMGEKKRDVQDHSQSTCHPLSLASQVKILFLVKALVESKFFLFTRMWLLRF